MKKLSIILICISIVLSFAACSDTNNAEQQGAEADASQSAATVTASGANNEDLTEQTAAPEQSVESDTQNIDKSEVESEDEQMNSKVLVAYFSATGTTEGAAEKIAAAADADLYRIAPAQPYTDEDLNYNSDSSRTTIEMNDSMARPEISGEVTNWDNYDTVYLGYPIWWGEAPRIMDTFVESYNFDGKTVIPFCTSGGSGIGSSAQNLEKLSGGGNWLEGTRLSGGISEEEAAEWISEISR